MGCVWFSVALLVGFIFLGTVMYARSRRAHGQLVTELRKDMRQLGWEVTHEDGQEIEWARDGALATYEPRGAKWNVLIETQERPWTLRAEFEAESWHRALLVSGEVAQAYVAFSPELRYALDELWALPHEYAELRWEGGTLAYETRLFEDWSSVAPSERMDVSFEDIELVLETLRDALEATPPKRHVLPTSLEAVVMSDAPDAWRQRVLGLLLLTHPGSEAAERLIEFFGSRPSWHPTFAQHVLHPTAEAFHVPPEEVGELLYREDLDADDTDADERAFLRGRLAAMLLLPEPLARRLSRDIWTHQTHEEIERALYFTPGYWRTSHWFGYESEDDLAPKDEAKQVFAWFMDEGHLDLSLATWVQLFRGAYDFRSTYSLTHALEEFWGGWPTEHRWAAQLTQHEDSDKIEALCREIGLGASGRAFWQLVLGRPVREELFTPVLSYMMRSQDATLLPMLLEVRERWRGDERYDHVAWEGTLRVLRDNVDPEMLGLLTASGDGVEGGLSVASAPEGGLEVLDERT